MIVERKSGYRCIVTFVFTVPHLEELLTTITYQWRINGTSKSRMTTSVLEKAICLVAVAVAAAICLVAVLTMGPFILVRKVVHSRSSD
jgi:hypothetical protein